MNQSNNNGISAITNEINQENEEVIEEVEDIEEVENLDLRQYQDKKPRKVKKSGVGAIVKIDNPINKDDVINALVKSSGNQVIDLETSKQYLLVCDKKISEVCKNEYVKSLLGKEYASMTLNEYIIGVYTLLPMLDCYKCSSVNGQFCSLAHVQGTSLIIQKFLPFYETNIEGILDERKNIKAVNLTMINRLFPSDSRHLFGVPGKTDTTVGGDKALLTYAEKFSGTFPFLKTYTFKESTDILASINNLLNVLNEYKESYNAATGYPIEGNYVTMWRYSLDTIAHYYLEKSLIPDMSEFTLNKLLDAFPLASMANTFLEPYKTDGVEQVMKEFHIDTVAYRPKLGYFEMRNTLNVLISMQYGKKLPLGKTPDYFSTKAMTKNINGPVGVQGKLNKPDRRSVLIRGKGH